MKKLLLFILPLMFLLTGCVNYQNVEDYAKEMQEVRKQHTYTVEATVKTSSEEAYIKSYFKGNKWKFFVSKNDGKTYEKDYMLYTGKNLYSYDAKRKTAMLMDFSNMLGNNLGSKSGEISSIAGFATNILNLIYDWHLDFDNPKVSSCKMWQFFGYSIKNGNICRSIKYNDKVDMCVSDRYGIAVYSKIRNSKNHEVEINVTKINTSPLSDNEFKLPSGTKIYSMSNTINNAIRDLYKSFGAKSYPKK